MTDVAVLGAGLAGLAAARDLMRGGADVVVLEARPRVGGRVEAMTLDDGRTVQLGGEVVGDGHHAYLELIAELGLSVEPSYVADPGQMSWGLHEGVYIGDAIAQAGADHLCGLLIEVGRDGVGDRAGKCRGQAADEPGEVFRLSRCAPMDVPLREGLANTLDHTHERFVNVRPTRDGLVVSRERLQVTEWCAFPVDWSNEEGNDAGFTCLMLSHRFP